MSVMVICGRLGRDAELRRTQKGTAVAEFSIADDVGYGDKRTTMWVKCAMFGERAEKVHPHLTKGKLVEVHGQPSVEAWTDKKDGTAKATIKLSVHELKLHGGGERQTEPTRPKPRGAQDDDGDSIPF